MLLRRQAARTTPPTRRQELHAPGSALGEPTYDELAEFCEPSREDVEYYKRARRAGATHEECLEFAETDRGLRVLHRGESLRRAA